MVQDSTGPGWLETIECSSMYLAGPAEPVQHTFGMNEPCSEMIWMHCLQAAKTAALGPRRDLDALPDILIDPMLSRFQSEAAQAEETGWFWKYKVSSVQVRLLMLAVQQLFCCDDALCSRDRLLRCMLDKTCSSATAYHFCNKVN